MAGSATRAAGLLRRAWTPLLSAWFVALSAGRLWQFTNDSVPIGLDARLYHRAVMAWLAGQDPWAVGIVVSGHPFSFAGTPATLALLAPASLLSEDLFTILWLGATLLATGWILARLRLAPWWLLFPPIVECLYSGNPQQVVLALLLLPGGAAGLIGGAVSVALKVYAAAPMAGERRPRGIAAGITLTVLTAIVAPDLWLRYLREAPEIASRLASEASGGYSGFGYPLILVPVAVLLILLARRDARAAGWLAVPALWPATEFHYSTFALPVMSPFLAAGLAIPIQQIPPLVIGIEAARRLVGRPRAAPWPRLLGAARDPERRARVIRTS